MELKKGMRVRAEWFEAMPFGAASLAGVQVKTAATKRTVEGEVLHIRADHPEAPTSIGVWIKPDSGIEVVTGLRNIVAVLNEKPRHA